MKSIYKRVKRIDERLEALEAIWKPSAKNSMEISLDVQEVIRSAIFKAFRSSKDNKSENRQWWRFELTVQDDAQEKELNALLDRLDLSRYELALIVSSLRVRPEFSLEDFCT